MCFLTELEAATNVKFLAIKLTTTLQASVKAELISITISKRKGVAGIIRTCLKESHASLAPHLWK
jgi:hypothetical protein